jgi:hypothetical protein
MTDPRVAAIEVRLKRLNTLTLVLAVCGIGYIVVAIVVLSQFGRYMGAWVALAYIPIPISGIAVAVLRMHTILVRTELASERVRVQRDGVEVTLDEIERDERNRD